MSGSDQAEKMLTTPLLIDDCYTNPDNCQSGFSVRVDLKGIKETYTIDQSKEFRILVLQLNKHSLPSFSRKTSLRDSHEARG